MPRVGSHASIMSVPLGEQPTPRVRPDVLGRHPVGSRLRAR